MERRYKIYCLIDPRTNNPFYVGATSVGEKKRLSIHINDDFGYCKTGYGKERYRFIQEIISAGYKPLISVLTQVTFSEVDKSESFFYHKLIKEGHTLIQSNSFHYQKNVKRVFTSSGERQYKVIEEASRDVLEKISAKIQKARKTS